MGKPGEARRAALVAAGALVLTATGPMPGTLARLEPGLWTLRDLDDPSVAHPPVCVADPATLVQLRHRGAPCSRFVIASDAAGATVHYTCPANGFGRTTVRVETPRLAKIDTQGIAGNAPFAYRLEARRTGTCQDGVKGGR